MPAPKNGRTILLAEDDLEVRNYLETALRCQGYSVELAQDGEEVLACLAGGVPIAAVVLDMIMPRRDGLDALRELRRSHRDLPVVMISGSSSPLRVVEAMKSGANDYVCKPINPDDLRKALKNALEARPAPIPVERHTAKPDASIFFGVCPQMLELRSTLAQIAMSETPVLIQGETGVGKEVIARELHALSPRAKKPMLKLNCAALPSELVESELFGYERGAFTGAFQRKPGMFELADGGTILLDEIGDMDFKLQAKLLQVLQDQQFQRLGGKDPVHVDVRIIAATHRDLEKAIANETFREDLYYRLNVINVRVPPLRERREDILALAEFLIAKHTPAGTPELVLPASLRQVFLDYHWPGNIREVENAVRKFIVLRDPEMIRRGLRGAREMKPAAPIAFPGPAFVPPPAPAAQEAPAREKAESILQQVASAKREEERAAIVATLRSTNWNRRHAAVILNIDYKALLYKMKKLAIRPEKRSYTVQESAVPATAASAAAGAD